MNIIAKTFDFKGENMIKLRAGDYMALIAPFNGSNVAKLEQTALGVDVLRNNMAMTPAQMKKNAAVYGMPTLYLPNRLSKGVLKVSDATYQFPLNDPLGNHLHGFLHERNHEIVDVFVDGDKAVAKTAYVYDEKDPFFTTYPVSFKAEFTFTLTAEGLGYEFTLTNTSADKQMPYGVCNHIAFNAPFTPDGLGVNVRLSVPINEKYEITGLCIPTENTLPLTGHDMMYKNGDMVPVLQDIDNDLYSATMNTLDGEDFYGVILKDTVSGIRVCYEVSDVMKYWIMWNDKGQKGFICPEPMSWNIDAPNLKGDPSVTGYCELAPGENKTVTERLFVKA